MRTPVHLIGLFVQIRLAKSFNLNAVQDKTSYNAIPSKRFTMQNEQWVSMFYIEWNLLSKFSFYIVSTILNRAIHPIHPILEIMLRVIPTVQIQPSFIYAYAHCRHNHRSIKWDTCAIRCRTNNFRDWFYSIETSFALLKWGKVVGPTFLHYIVLVFVFSTT